MACNLGHPMGLRQPVAIWQLYICITKANDINPMSVTRCRQRTTDNCWITQIQIYSNLKYNHTTTGLSACHSIGLYATTVELTLKSFVAAKNDSVNGGYCHVWYIRCYVAQSGFWGFCGGRVTVRRTRSTMRIETEEMTLQVQYAVWGGFG